MRARVIVVDDDPSLRRMLGDFLSQEGWEVLLAADGAAALSLCRDSDADIVLCDVGLPDISGFQLARELRRDARTADIPVVFFTGDRRAPEEIERELDGGAYGYILKPADMRLVQAKLEAVLRVVKR